MVESSNSFDDVEFEDEIEDLWYDDVLNEDHILDDHENLDVDSSDFDNSKNTVLPTVTKKRSFIKALVILIILGSAAYLFLPILLSSNMQEQNIPIIKLGGIQNQVGIPTIKQSVDSSINEAVLNVTNAIEQNEPVSGISAQNTSYNDVLTPMPDNLHLASTELADLTETLDNKIPENIEKNIPAQPDIVPNIVEAKQDLLFSEEELLSKTESSFKDNAKLEEQDISDKAMHIEEIEIVDKIEASDINKNIIGQTAVDISGTLEEVLDNKPVMVMEVKKILEDPSGIKSDKIVSTPKKKRPAWIIRAAQSGSAVIYDKASKEMKSIEINDIVSGIGRVKSIKIIDGIWVITGTSGKIKQ